MGFGRKLLKGAAKKAATTLMDRVGGRFVSTLGDTSSDAPSATFEPKRNLYEQMQRGEVGEDGRAIPPVETAEDASGEEAAEADHGHSHSHGHSHDHS
jgi:hypothetical protein